MRSSKRLSIALLALVITVAAILLPTNVAFADTFTVTTTDDTVTDDSECSLREAISEVNGTSVEDDCLTAAGGTPDTIAFDIGSGQQTIAISAGDTLTLTAPVIIDGTTQPGGTSCPDSLLIEIDGSATTDQSGLLFDLGSDGSTVRGLVMSNWDRAGIEILSDDNVIQCNFLGTNVAGTGSTGGLFGVVMLGTASNNLIGTDGDDVNDTDERNLLSGNRGTTDEPDEFGVGVAVNGSDAQNNTIAGNYIGTDVTGASALHNTTAGVYLFLAGPTVVGTNGDGSAGDDNEGNVISGNNDNSTGETGSPDGMGIYNGDTDDVVIAGNFIGVDATGTSALGNATIGIYFDGGPSNNVIGTNGNGVSDEDERNIISGNGRNGILLEDPVTVNNVIAGNYIGTDVTGTAAIGNNNGVRLSIGASNNLIGTNGDGENDEAERNVISGNSQNGLFMRGSGDGGVFTTGNNVVAGNYIGTNASGTSVLANGNFGVLIQGHTNGNLIGTDGDGENDEAERNIISGNTAGGIEISSNFDQGPTVDNVVAGNYIGADINGTVALGNGSGTGLFGGSHGVFVANGPTGTVVGGDTPEEGNLIVGNNFGVYIQGILETNVVVQYNYVGTNPVGADLENRNGIYTVQNEVGSTQILNNVVAFHDAAAGRSGIRIGNNAQVVVPSAFNCVYNNGRGGFLQISNTSSDFTNNVNLENNWWGAPDGPSGLGTGSGDSIVIVNNGTNTNGTIDFDPFLSNFIDCGENFGIALQFAFQDEGPFQTGQSVVGVFTIPNPALLGLSPTDFGFDVSLPNGLTIDLDTPPVVGTDCGSLTPSAATLSGGASITFTGGSIASGDTCEVEVTLINSRSGTYNATDLTVIGFSDATLGALTVALDGSSAEFFRESDDDDDDDEAGVLLAADGSLLIADPGVSKIGFLRPGQTGVQGEVIEWVVTVSNTGGIAATNVTITDIINPALRPDRVDGANGNISGQAVTVNLGTLQPGQTVIFSIFTTVLDGVLPGNTACLTADGVNERCASAPSPAGVLPQTGETPPWRLPLIIVMVGITVGVVGFGVRWLLTPQS